MDVYVKSGIRAGQADFPCTSLGNDTWLCGACGKTAFLHPTIGMPCYACGATVSRLVAAAPQHFSPRFTGSWDEQRWLTKEERETTETVMGHNGPTLTAMSALKKKGKEMVYNLRISSPFVLTQTHVKKSLGAGFTILSIEAERDIPNRKITDVDSAVLNIVQAGYRALARAHHPDLGGDPDTMVILNRAKKELTELLESLK